jgi:glutathione S-transferase
MVLKLYGTRLSPGVKLVALVLEEKGIPFEHLHPDHFAGEHRTPEFRAKLNPFGMIPVIVCLLPHSFPTLPLMACS